MPDTACLLIYPGLTIPFTVGLAAIASAPFEH